ncbi:MAG: efflux RND transporter permease subunit [Paludibacteraceae bacterium]|nr:efflux RND transporter permease subunit [Paludibacteraceae bacterium]
MKRNIIHSAIAHKKVVYVILLALIAIGIIGIFKMNRDEFPTFQIKQGLVAAIYPGASAREVEEQVTRPLEKILFSFPEVSRSTTYSYSKNGICYIYVDLVVDQNRKDEVWSKIKLKLNQAKLQLPAGVLGVAVIDDFSSVATMLVALESSDKGYVELKEYADNLARRLESIPELASVKITGAQEEEIAINVDFNRLSAYGIDPATLMANFQTSGLQTISGTFRTSTITSPIYINSNLANEGEIANHIIYTDPQGNALRLKDIATIERRYRKADAMVSFNGNDAIILSVEMRNDNNIVEFGREVNRVLDDFRTTLPPSVTMSNITDQPRVVDDSILSFLRDLVISMLVVIAVMLLLFPMRSALIASSGVPVCTAIAIAVMYVTHIDLNTVTLAALIVVLGMIVDDSIITMDGYMAHLNTGASPEDAAARSGKELIMPMFMATAAICTMFFPMTGIISGYLGDFVRLFPWVITFALGASLAYAVFVVPSLEVRFIQQFNPATHRTSRFERIQHHFFDALQKGYEKIQQWCFDRPILTISAGLALVAVSIVIFLNLNIQMMPMAARDFFAVEVYLEPNSTVDETKAVTDSLEHILIADKRVKSVTSFVGTSAPRFNATYAPVVPQPSFAQMIVNTHSKRATNAMLREYQNTENNIFPNAVIRYKQMDYQATPQPLVVNISGASTEEMKWVADSIRDYMLTMDDMLQCVRSTADGCITSVGIDLDPDESARLGINRTMLSLFLNNSLNGITVTTLYEGDERIPVVLYNNEITDSSSYDVIGNQIVPTMLPPVKVPLRSVASVAPKIDAEQYYRNAGIETIAVGADLKYGQSHPAAMKRLNQYIDTHIRPILPSDITIKPAGLASINDNVIPEIILSFIAAVAVLFLFLLFHFKKVSLSVLTMLLSTLCLFGAFLGLWLFDLDFGLTSVLGLISLVGIIVRNGIIMFEYAEELRVNEGMDARTAAMLAGQRRMRPIFLTSCTTALGVIPMIIAGELLWMPMGVVICFGTMLSIVMVVLLMPVSYWMIYRLKERGNKK